MGKDQEVRPLEDLVDFAYSKSILDEDDLDLTIYAREPWTPESPALLLTHPEDDSIPSEAASQCMSYMLEVPIAREFFLGTPCNPPPLYDERFHPEWMKTRRSRCLRLIQYAINDA